MKQILLLFICISTVTTTSAQQPKFDIKFSEPLAVFVFVQQLSSSYPGNSFKSAFTGSAYDQDKYKDLITRFANLTLSYAYEFPSFPTGSKMPVLTDRLLKKNLIDCNSLEDFKLRSLGLIPNADLIELTNILDAFTRPYNELIYNPNKEKFEKQFKSLSAYFLSKNVSDYFRTGILFYNSAWDNSIPFEIALYPLPDPKGFTAEAFINNAVSAIPTNENNYDGLLSVMMHEIFHMIYNEQSLKVKLNMKNWFDANPSKCSTYAFWLLNEAFATVLGNGYVYERLHGTVDTADWYNQKYINAMAKKLYPIVTEYIAGNKAIDQDFINRYIKIYQDNYSGWLSELNNLLTYRYVVTDNGNDFDTLGFNYPYTSYSDFEDHITESEIRKMTGTPVTKLIIISKERRAELNMVKNSFTELKNWQYLPYKEFTYHTFLKDRTQLIIVNRFKTPIVVLLRKTFKN